MTTLLVAPPVLASKTAVCEFCGPRRSVLRRAVSIPKDHPRNLGTDHLIETFKRHPWLEDSEVGALAQSLRDAVVSNA